MTPTDPAGAGPDRAGTPPDAQNGQPGAAPGPGAAETVSAARPDAENTGVDTTDRPGDIPYDQAAAEHENPALG